MKVSDVKDVKIGLEVHVELNTDSKLFCGCSTSAVEPNSSTCEICLGLPGSKPVLNKKAVDFGLISALALNCNINQSFFFSRKTYFYPDLGKNFQITQYEIPLGERGFVLLSSGKKINLTRVHLEEDPASLIRLNSGKVLMDYNRSGNPLIEIVSEPDISSPSEAREFLHKLISILDYLGVIKFGETLIKADCNVSIHNGNRVEIKNVSGFQAVEKSLSFEILRQYSLVSNGEKIEQQTRGFDADSNSTFLQRVKETEADYGYIFEPDLPEVSVDDAWLNSLKEKIPELPDEKLARFVSSFGLKKSDAEVLVSNKKLADLFESVSKKVDVSISSKFFIREFLGILNYNNLELNFFDLSSSDFENQIIELLSLFSNNKISDKNLKLATIEFLVNKKNPVDFLKSNNLLLDLDSSDLESIVFEILEENKDAVSDYKSGNDKALNFIIGMVMRKAKGKANFVQIKKIVDSLLN